jgi:uroporphyrinogen-III synthase
MKPTVALTRTSSANRRMASDLESSGFSTLDWSAISLLPITEGAEAIPEALRSAQVLVFVSPGLVDVLEIGWPGWTEWVSSTRIASMGPGTTLALRKVGVQAHFQADPPRAEGMLETLLREISAEIKIRILCGDRSRPDLLDGLREGGLEAEECVVYQSTAPESLQRTPRPLHAVVYGSPSSAERMLQANPWLYEIPAVALGPTTGGWLRSSGGHRRVLEAKVPDSKSVIEVLQRL